MNFDKVFKQGFHELGYFKGNLFLKVFHHSYANKENFTDRNEALYYNSNDKFSILANITEKMKTDDKYEFIIDYPNEKQYFRWKQNNNPLDEGEYNNKKEAEGFEMIYNTTDAQSFGGLVNTTIPNDNKISCLLNGIPGDGYWYFAIGMYKERIDVWANREIPGYKGGVSVNYVSLWIKIYPLNVIFSCKNILKNRIGLNTNIFIMNYFHVLKG